MRAATVVPATVDDFRAVYGREPERSFQGFAVRVGDKPMAVCGLYRAEGLMVAFSQIAGPLPKKAAVRAVHRLLELMRSKGTTIYAKRDESLPTSGTLLSHMGFAPVADAGGGIYEWHG